MLFVSALMGSLHGSESEAVQNVIEAYRSAWVANNAEAVMQLFAPDAVLLPHHGDKPVIGVAAIRNFWFPKDAPAVKIIEFESKTAEIGGNGEFAFARGEFDLKFSYIEGGTEQRRSNRGTWIMLFQKRRGKWLITHRMWDDPQAIRE